MLSLFIFSALSFNLHHRTHENTYCVCEGDNCSTVCGEFQRIDSFSPGKIFKAIKERPQTEVLFFLIANSGEDKEDMPYFNLTTFQQRSFVIEPLNPLHRESIVLRPGHVDHDLFHSFKNLDIILDTNGIYDFYNLKLRNTAVKCDANADITFEQDIINTDFESLYHMPITIYDPPTLGAFLQFNRTVSNIEFWDDHTLVFKSTNILTKEHAEVSFTFSQIKSRGNSTISLNSPNVNWSFHSYPDNSDFFPKLTIELHRTTHFIFNFPGEGDFHESMNLEDRITIDHGSHGVYINSNDGTMAPTFSHIGKGPFLRNNKPIDYHDTYCLCNNETLGNEKCQETCGSTPFSPFSEIEYTIIGNPKESIKYIITGSTDAHKNLPNSKIHADMPLFDIEHFKDKNITVYGMSKNEHIRIIGDTTDDPDDAYGFHKFSELTIHTTDTFSFPAVALYSVHFEFDVDAANTSLKKPEELGFFNCTRLEIDLKSLHNLKEKHIPLLPPVYSSAIHTTNIIKTDLIVKVINMTSVMVDGLVIPIKQHTLLKIFCGGSLTFEVSKDFSNKVSDFPKLTFVLEGDQNTINFVGTWPESLETLTSKVTAEHGDNPLYSNGDYDGTSYKFTPPTIAHEGAGAYFVNGLLTNYHSHYCICQGSICQEECSKNAEDAPIIGFSEKEISATARGNPTRMIEYTVIGTGETFDKRPFFGLHDYTYRSFMITTPESGKKENIAIEGALEDFEATSSVSHIFENLNIMLANPGYYVFNSIELTNCEFTKHIPAEGEAPSPYENKETNKTQAASLLSYTEFYFHQNGMRSDLHSLQSLQSNDLLNPCSLYLTVEGEDELYQISILDSDTLKIYGLKDDHTDNDENELQNSKYDPEITLDVGNLAESAAMFNIERKTSYEHPFIVHWAADGKIRTPSQIPHFSIDLSQSSNEAFVQFEGRKWTEGFHNLTSFITVFYGLVEIHIMTQVKDLENSVFSGQPPHVNLIGDTDYYINDVKQVSVNAPGNHSSSEDDDDEKNVSKNTIVIFGIIIVGFLLALFVFLNTPKSNEEMMPAMRIIKEHSEEDENITPILNQSEYNGEKPNFKVIS